MIFLIVLLYAVLASTFTLGKVAVGYADPFFLIAVRMLLAGTLLLTIHHLAPGTKKPLVRADWKLFLTVSLFHISIPFSLEFWALQYVSSTKTSMIYALTPFIAALLTYLLRGRGLSFSQTAGLFIGLLGLIPIFLAKGDLEHAAGEFLHVSLPEAGLLLAVTAASYAWFMITDLMKKGYTILHINGLAMLLGGVLNFFLWVFTADFSESPIQSFWPFLGWTLALVAASNGIVYNLYGWLLKRYSITFMGMAGFLSPIFCSVYGSVFLDEQLSAMHALALIFVTLGLWIFYRDDVKREVGLAKNSA